MQKLVEIKQYAQTRERRKSLARKSLSVGTFLGPYTVTFAMFFVFPLVFGIIMAFGKFTPMSFLPEQGGTLENFAVLFGDNSIAKDFWEAVWTTIKFCACIVKLFFLAVLISYVNRLCQNLIHQGLSFFLGFRKIYFISFIETINNLFPGIIT